MTSLDFNIFYMIQKYFSHVNFLKLDLISWGASETNSAEQLNCLVSPLV